MKSHKWLVFNIVIILIIFTSFIQSNRNKSERRPDSKQNGESMDSIIDQFSEDANFNKNLTSNYNQGEMIPGFETIHTTPGFYGPVINNIIPNYLTENLKLLKDYENSSKGNSKIPGFDQKNKTPGFDHKTNDGIPGFGIDDHLLTDRTPQFNNKKQ